MFSVLERRGRARPGVGRSAQTFSCERLDPSRAASRLNESRLLPSPDSTLARSPYARCADMNEGSDRTMRATTNLFRPARHATGSAHVVETDGLSKRFGDKTVVDEVELQVPRGVAFGYLGPNRENLRY